MKERDRFYDPDEYVSILDEEDEEGCVFPGECCMPGPHRKSECHTQDMVEMAPAAEAKTGGVK